MMTPKQGWLRVGAVGSLLRRRSGADRRLRGRSAAVRVLKALQLMTPPRISL